MSRALGCTDLLVDPRYDGPLPEGGSYVRHSRTSHVSVYSSPCVEAEADGPTVVYISPTQPEGVDRGNWIQFNPRKAGRSGCGCTARCSPSSKTWRARRDRVGELAAAATGLGCALSPEPFVRVAA